jgi:hypothetical protein
LEYLKKKWAPYDNWSQRVAFRCDFCNHIEGVNGIYLYWINKQTGDENPSYLICKDCSKQYDKENELE